MVSANRSASSASSMSGSRSASTAKTSKPPVRRSAAATSALQRVRVLLDQLADDRRGRRGRASPARPARRPGGRSPRPPPRRRRGAPALAAASSSPSRWARNAGVLLEDRDEQPVAATEVVVDGAPVALAGPAGDLDQRRRLHALLGERARGSVDQLLPGLRGHVAEPTHPSSGLAETPPVGRATRDSVASDMDMDLTDLYRTIVETSADGIWVHRPGRPDDLREPADRPDPRDPRRGPGVPDPLRHPRRGGPGPVPAPPRRRARVGPDPRRRRRGAVGPQRRDRHLDAGRARPRSADDRGPDPGAPPPAQRLLRAARARRVPARPRGRARRRDRPEPAAPGDREHRQRRGHDDRRPPARPGPRAAPRRLGAGPRLRARVAGEHHAGAVLRLRRRPRGGRAATRSPRPSSPWPSGAPTSARWRGTSAS